MTKVLQLESLQGRRQRCYIVFLADHAKREHEHRVARVDGIQPVVTAFINENQIVAETVAHAANSSHTSSRLLHGIGRTS